MPQETNTAPQTILALVRHGEYSQPEGVPSAHLPHPLTASGQEHARRGALLLFQFAEAQGLDIFDRIYCSRMLRAWQTAQVIRQELDRLGADEYLVEEKVELAERSMGAVANLTATAIEKLIVADPRYDTPPPGWKRSPEYKAPFQGAESLLEAGARVGDLLKHESTREGQTRVLKIFVGHGGAFRHAAHHLGILKREDLATLSMHHGVPVYISRKTTDCLAPFHQVGGEWKVREKMAPAD